MTTWSKGMMLLLHSKYTGSIPVVVNPSLCYYSVNPPQRGGVTTKNRCFI